MSTASAGTWRLSVRYRRIDSASTPLRRSVRRRRRTRPSCPASPTMPRPYRRARAAAGRRTVRHEPGTVDDDVVIHTFARQQAVQRGIYQQSRERGEEPHTFQSDQRGDGQQLSRRVHAQQHRIEHAPAHNGRRQQRRQRRQRHAEIHSGLPHQSSSSRRCAETRHYTAEPAAIPLTPAAITTVSSPACAMPYNRRFALFTRLGHTAATSCVYSTGRISIWNRIISCCWESSS